jgi:hypothetical protein
MSQTKVPLLSLPVAPTLPQSLTSDAIIKSPQALFSLSKYSGKDGEPMPSMLRRSRQIAHAHFSYVSPMPTSFPYAIPEAVAKEIMKPGEDGIDIEALLSKIEPDLDHPVFSESNSLNAYTSPLRLKLLSKAKLLGLSQKCLDDMLPTLDVGDAVHSIASSATTESEPVKQLEEVLSGRAVMTNKGAENQLAPWSLVYGGHQFGQWQVSVSLIVSFAECFLGPDN